MQDTLADIKYAFQTLTYIFLIVAAAPAMFRDTERKYWVLTIPALISIFFDIFISNNHSITVLIITNALLIMFIVSILFMNRYKIFSLFAALSSINIIIITFIAEFPHVFEYLSRNISGIIHLLCIVLSVLFYIIVFGIATHQMFKKAPDIV